MQSNVSKKPIVRDFALFLIDLLGTVLFWGGFYRAQFGADTLFREMLPMSDIGSSMDQQRYAAYYLAKWLLDIGIQITDHYRAFFFIYLLSIAADIWLIQKLFLPLLKDRESVVTAGFLAAASLAFLNVLFSETFMFPEFHITYTCAYLLATVGVFFYARKRLLFPTLCILIACLFYQSAVIYAAMLYTGWLVISEEFVLSGKLVRRVLVGNMVFLLIGVLDYASSGFVKYIGLLEPEAESKTVVFEGMDTIRYIAEETILLFKNSLNLLPSLWLPLAASLLAAVLTFLSLSRKKGGVRPVTLILLILAEALLFLSIPLLSASMYPRITFVFYTWQALLLIGALCVTEKAWIRRTFAVMCILYLLVHAFFSQLIIGNRYLSNQLDIVYAEAVLREAAHYEEKTGIKITRIAIANDAYAPNSYDAVRFKRDQINERLLSVSPFVLLEHLNGPGMQLTHIPMDRKIFEEHFGDRDWDRFDPEEQLWFDGDTLYWCVF
ncbi:MAG: hypothetical protein K5696_01385 [Lachnospiraceae bacterium]|nr:hypothetical protein [Lachnospiraceae bacterium]